MVEGLLRAQADANLTDSEASTPLHRAAAAGDGAAPCVRALLAAGATATVADGSGKSA